MTPPSPHTSSKGLSRFIILFLLVCVLGFIIWKLQDKDEEKGSKGGDRPIPVKTAQVTRQNVPYYLSGIGTVISPHQVTIRPQVEGELMSLHFAEGQTINKGELLAEIDPRPFEAALKQAEAGKGSIAAQLQLAETELTRNAKLLESDAVSRQEVDTRKANVAELKAQLLSADAAIAAAQVNLGYTKILSPVTGRVGIRSVDPGNIVSATDTIVTITQINPINVIFTLPQNAIGEINSFTTEQDEKMPVTVYDRDKGKELAAGHLETVDNAIDSATGTIKLKSVFENANNALWPGQHVTARLQHEVKDNALVIPVKALQLGRDGNFVFRVKEDKSVENIPVKVSFQDDDIAIINEGLNENEVVVVDGQMRLKPGSKITTADPSKDGNKDSKK